MATTQTPKAQCVQYLEGGRRCSRKATHYLPNKPTVTTCTQHARSYDVPMPKADR